MIVTIDKDEFKKHLVPYLETIPAFQREILEQMIEGAFLLSEVLLGRMPDDENFRKRLLEELKKAESQAVIILPGS